MKYTKINMKIVKTTTSDGIIFSGLLSVPKNGSKKIIIHIHGMAGNPIINSFYQPMHDYYTKNGFAFLAGENRGMGTLSELVIEGGVKMLGNAIEKFEDCVMDIDAWVSFAKSKGYDEIWLQGHSLGPSKIAYYMFTQKPKNIKGLILISPSDMTGWVNVESMAGEHKIMLEKAKQLMAEGKENTLIDRSFWGNELMSSGTYLNFFDENTKTAIFNFGNEERGWEVVNSIDLPVLAITGEKDDGIVPIMEAEEAMEKLKQELKSSPRVRTIVYPGALHSFDGFEKNIVEDVVRFINND